jgi:hypothetical protein
MAKGALVDHAALDSGRKPSGHGREQHRGADRIDDRQQCGGEEDDVPEVHGVEYAAPRHASTNATPDGRRHGRFRIASR